MCSGEVHLKQTNGQAGFCFCFLPLPYPKVKRTLLLGYKNMLRNITFLKKITKHHLCFWENCCIIQYCIKNT